MLFKAYILKPPQKEKRTGKEQPALAKNRSGVIAWKAAGKVAFIKRMRRA